MALTKVHNRMIAGSSTDVMDFGAVGDGITDDTIAIQAALDNVNSNGGGKVTFPKGTYKCSTTLTIYGNTVVTGIGSDNSTLSFSSGTGNCLSLAPASVDANIEISSLTIVNTVVDRVVINMADLGERSNITIRDCELSNIPSLVSDVITLLAEMSNVLIENNTILANPTNPTITTDSSNDQHCIRIATDETDYDAREIRIIGNEMVGGATGYAHGGLNASSTGVWFQDNLVRGQKFRGAFFYHGRDLLITNNTFRDIVAPAGQNNDNGVVWLDRFGAETTYPTSAVFSGNMIVSCTGNAVYCEELSGGNVSNNVIKTIAKRTADTYSYAWTFSGETDTFTSDGGNGILITGGVYNTVFSGNTIQFCDANGILLSQPLGAHPELGIGNVHIEDNSIYNNGEDGILFQERFLTAINIVGNDIQGNGTSGVSPVDNTFAGIKFTQQNSNSTTPPTLISGNTIGNGLTTLDNNQYFGFYKNYAGGNWLITGNTIATNGGYWVENLSPSSMRVSENFLQGSRGITSSGSAYVIRDNIGYKLEFMSSVSVDSGTGQKDITHGLVTTPTGVVATVQGTGGDYAQVDNIGASTFRLSVYSDAGTLQTATRTVMVYAFKNWVSDRA